MPQLLVSGFSFALGCGFLACVGGYWNHKDRTGAAFSLAIGIFFMLVWRYN